MMRSTLNRFGLVGAVAFVAACSATSGSSLFDNAGGGGEGGAGVGQGGNSAAKSSSSTATPGGGDDMGVVVGAGGGTPNSDCSSTPGQDNDKDGYAAPEDCNDCDPNVNPGAIEVIATAGKDGTVPAAADEDCDGKVDNLPALCDEGLAIDDKVPMNAAKAVDLCKVPKDVKDWGVVSAKWTLADGSTPPAKASFDLGHGLLSTFGPNVNVQAGKRMLALSSGTARQPSDAGYQSPSGYDKLYTGNQPQGFPKESPACPSTTTGQPHDAAALELTIRAPTNAHGFSFDFNFFTYEWPQWVCSKYNDFFVALLTPKPVNQADGNISFDSQGNPVSVNNAFVEVCSCASGPPCTAGGKKFSCLLGNKGLKGTGFDDGNNSASTSWLVTKAPIDPGQQITIRWAVYDSADGVLDTTTLIDHWQWIADSGTTVGTGQVPTPK